MKVRILLIMTVILIIVSSKVFSNTIVVTTSTDSISGSLRDAVSISQSGDTIIFNNSLTEIKLGRQIEINKSVTISGNPGLLIHLFGEDSILQRIFEIAGNTPVTVNLSNLELDKPGIHIGDTTSLILNGGIILISNTSATVNINSCYLTRKEGFGGYIHCPGIKLNGQNGGGIAQYGGTLNISNTTFSDLEAGGAVYWGAGGAIFQSGGNLNLSSCTFYHNSAGITSCGNYIGSGASIYTQDGTLQIRNCTFAENETLFTWFIGLDRYTGHAYTINNYNSTINIKNTIFYNNKNYDINGSFNSGGYNIFQQALTVSDTTSIFNCNPGFKLNNTYVELSDNSYWIPICALDAAGPAIDALPPDGNGAPEFDQRGHSRLNTADIGAYEFEGCIPPVIKTQWNASDFGLDSWASDISVANDSIVWVKDTDADSISISMNGGATWESKPLPSPVGGSTGVGGICALSASIAYCILSTGDSKGIYMTADTGNNWIKQTTGFNQSSLFPDFIHFWNENEGVAIGDASPNFEIYTTVNGGIQWNRVQDANMPNGNNEGTFNNQGSFRVVGNSFYFIIGSAKIFRSLDKGNTWSVINTPFHNATDSIISFDFKDNNFGLVSYCSNDGLNHKMYKTSNGGQTWDSVPSNNFYQRIKYIPSANAWFSMNINGGLSYSCDDGQTWTEAVYFDDIRLISVGYSSTGDLFWGGKGSIYYSSAILSVSSDSLIIAAPENSTQTFDITSNTHWTITSNTDWLIIDNISGSGNATITLTALENPLYTAREAMIKVSGTGVTGQTIIVIQDALITGTNDKNLVLLSLFPNPVTKELTINDIKVNATISIYTITGTLLIRKTSESSTEIIDVSSLSNGVYIISISVNNNRIIKKFIKQ